ncbi:tyrosine-type recombinase/integrase [Klebsiella pneumoniae]|uniref:tyrosine-type recombinase/integrase n=1 Tax=Klebsiella pneumoniae TaxID=573 RepID=UPI00210A64D4|nr:tyrosine-type recombinase/integrase [Klebsiella pneumoniae]
MSGGIFPIIFSRTPHARPALSVSLCGSLQLTPRSARNVRKRCRTAAPISPETGARINEALALTGASFQLDGSRPFVRLKTLKQRQRGRGRPGKDEEVFRLVPLTDPQYVRKVREFLTTLRIGKQQLLWPVQSDNTPRNWIRKALDLAKRDSVTFSIPVTCHTFRHSFCMHLIQHGVPLKVVQAYAGHSRLETTETYTRVFALDVGRQYGVRFSLPDSHLTLPE